MTRPHPRLRHFTAAGTLAAAALLFLPTATDAQGRGGPHVVHRSTVVVGGGFYYSPFFYSGFYGGWYPYQYGWYPPPYPYYGYGYGYDDSASLRLQVTPRQTEVFIDGYYAGTVDDFDGMFQRLNLDPGEHDLQLYLAGHRSVTQKIYLQRGSTFRVKHAMEALAAGEAEPVRPAITSPPPAQPRAAQGPGPAARPEPRDAGGRPPAGQSTYGTLALRVQPGDASVTIDGEKWEGSGGDQRLVVQLAPGTHVVEVRKEGYRGYISEVTIRSADTDTLNVALAKQ
jgi:hypothetical protein